MVGGTPGDKLTT